MERRSGDRMKCWSDDGARICHFRHLII